MGVENAVVVVVVLIVFREIIFRKRKIWLGMGAL